MMLDSKIIEIDGIFLGTAIQVKGLGGRRFYAAHESVRALHNAVKPDLAVMAQLVASQFRKSRIEHLAA
ncbi:hypothetical protein GC248_10580 [Acetobacter senegalensis]|nr:hypothetical protein CIW82_02705 [Acetobacter tropicalis]MPQ74321.1 hypothetical protein [Acetobacter senegalensis]